MFEWNKVVKQKTRIIGSILSIGTLAIFFQNCSSGFNAPSGGNSVGSQTLSQNISGAGGGANSQQSQQVAQPTPTPPVVIPGSMKFAFVPTPSNPIPSTKNYTFIVPNYTTLTVKVWGAGGGNVGGYCPDTSSAPLYFVSSFGSLKAGSGYGAKGFNTGLCTFNYEVSDGRGGVANGGATNINGNAGAGMGARGLISAPNGATTCVNGSYTPGGGLDGGGAGAYVEKTYTAGELAVGSTIAVNVAPSGSWAGPQAPPCEPGNGEVDVSWQ